MDFDYTQDFIDEVKGSLKRPGSSGGTNGKDGFSPTIKENKNNTADDYRFDVVNKNGTFTTPNLIGKDGKTPTITIGANNNWFVNGVDTGVKAKGEKGDTGSGFNTTRQYSSVSDMMADTNPANDSEIVVVVLGDVGNFYMRLSSYIDPDGATNGYLPIGSAQDISTIKGDPGKDGKDGLTPHIDSATNHWFLGTKDTGVLAKGQDGKDGKDGKSIKSITRNSQNHIIVTFTDGTTQDIGEFNVDIKGDFLTSGGFGNLRYYNGKFQYYDEVTSAWKDTSVSSQNPIVVNIMPGSMKKMLGVYDPSIKNYKLKWEEPNDTIIDGDVVCIVDKVIIRRKKDSVPTDENDGILIAEIKRRDFGKYKNDFFVDESLTPNEGDVYYYKAFPMSTTGFYNTASVNETDGIECKNYNLYGFKLDQNESDPLSMITYTEDNKYFEPARMDYNANTFKYGDWEDSWFIKNLKPCMLKYDGMVDYELDKNDYTKKLDGTDSDVANDSYGGNAMIGIPKVYWKIVDNGDNTANIYICDKKLDGDFVCWSHIDNNGNEIDYCYMPIYNGSNVNSVLRSISGKAPIVNQTATTEITYAKANNLTSDTIWYTEVFSDRMLINLLLLLIGKSTDTQTVFGNGHYTDGVSESSNIVSGTMNDKGLFYGTNGKGKGVKVFGMEHWWGNQWRRIAGWINSYGTQKIKLTYGQSDGSTVDGYNTDGTGYIVIPNSIPSDSSGGCISKILFNENGLIPTTANGSQTTYYCDGLWFNNSQIDYVLVGGSSANGYHAGAFSSYIEALVSVCSWNAAAAISCKPLATT